MFSLLIFFLLINKLFSFPQRRSPGDTTHHSGRCPWKTWSRQKRAQVWATKILQEHGREGKEHLSSTSYPFLKKSFCLKRFQKKNTRAGAWRKSPRVSLEVAPLNQRGTALQGHTCQGHLFGFCHCCAPSRINPFSQATFAPSSLPDPQYHPLQTSSAHELTRTTRRQSLR